ncbi:uncharacterized protein [Eurosta solidaginis]|uniref:uncharacterized protein n=1 Tax=Eurosta solidaginis TaxID=178769 RepID=UPI003530B34E
MDRKLEYAKSVFLKIFGETDQSIKTVCRQKIKGHFGGDIANDHRGKHSHHKLSIEKYNEVLAHIHSIPKYQSHYSRRHTSQLYFQRGLNLAHLYRLYKGKYSEPVSETKYQEIFRQLNIQFKKPQVDLCNKCEILKSRVENTTEENEKKQLLMEQKGHHDEADFAYNCKKTDKEIAINHGNVKMFSFDLQQCLPTPYLHASMFFYKRPLWTFNLTVHDGETKKANCYIWHEVIAKRGANDIGSCIFKCLMSLPESISHVIMYSDSCPGQNRNSYISAMFEQVIEKHPSIAVIDHKFLVVGHTHLECDSVHAQIERKKKNMSGSIQHPHDWANLIAATSSKYVVHEMKQEEFFDFSALLKMNYTWRTTNAKGDKFEWKNVRWMRYEKQKPGVLQYKTSLKPEVEFNELNINPRRPGKSIPILPTSYTSLLTITKNKKKDLLDMLPLINTDFHNFYRHLPAEGECEVEADSV